MLSDASYSKQRMREMLTSVASFLRRKLVDLFGIDVRALAIARIGFALLILADLANRARSFAAHYGDESVLPRHALLGEHYNDAWISLHLAGGELWFQALLFGVAAVFALMLLVGYKTRLATVVSWLLLISLQNINPLVVQGGDIELRMMLFWGIFLPWGRAYSLDAARSFKRPSREVITTVASAAALMQVLFVYFFASFLKTGAEWHEELSAVYYALSLDQFSTPVGEYMLQFPVVLMTLTAFVFWLQRLSLPLLFFPAYTHLIRFIATALLILMHAGFALHMQLGLFPYISIVSLLIFLPPFVWNWLFDRLKTPQRRALALYYDGDCGFCRKSVHIIRTFLLIPETLIAPAQKRPSIYEDMRREDSWVIVDHTGARHFGYDAGVVILHHSPLLWWLAPLARLPPLPSIGERLYRLIARNRSRLPLPDAAGKRGSQTKEILLQLIAAAAFIYVVMWNLTTVHIVPTWLPSWFNTPGYALRLDQKWNMFAPFPLKEDGWYVIPGELRNGEEVDLLTGEAVTYEKPEDVSATYPSQRWRKYLMNLWDRDLGEYRLYYGQWLCRAWNKAHDVDRQVTDFRIIFMLEETLPGGKTAPPERVELWRHQCFENPS